LILVVERNDHLQHLNFQRLVNQDGLVYADLDLAVQSGSARNVIHGQKDMTTYASVDLTKKADPLPDDFDEENTK